MGRAGISTEARGLLLDRILAGLPVKAAAVEAKVSHMTAAKYFSLWAGQSIIPAGHLCRCSKQHNHKGICLGYRHKIKKQPLITAALATEPGEHYTPTEWGEMLVGVRRELFAYMVKKTKNGPLSEDLVSETIVKCLQARLQFVKGTNFRAWMYRCLNNNWIGHFRLKKRVSDQTLEDIEQSSPELIIVPETETQTALANEIIVRIARELPEARETCFLRWIDDKSYEEIAAIQCVPVGTIKSVLWRAKNKLRRVLGENRGQDNE